MNIEAYFRSLSSECTTLKDRVRILIDENHWPTDGEWKESVLRSMIRRSAPDSITVGRGFVVDHDRCSKQIDVLVYDNSLPILYKDGDLVFVTPSSCRAIVEVKTRLTVAKFRKAAEDLAGNAEFIRPRGMGIPLFTGLFTYEIQARSTEPFLEAVKDVSNSDDLKIIDHVALGDSSFVKYWNTNPNNQSTRSYNYWHLYRLPQMSFGYFIHNLLVEVSRDPAARRDPAWFPKETKEFSLVKKMKFDIA